ncbi:hypothetical protein EYC80_003368 [Monilinia laxa]|uniref:Uncharacterized protein n=1 Tax=Monilinia laxa TaxID=61186 RepID=A0A5N6KDT7_MONLA|nr:hypothetical protein EYC80_003368 [Monilinia laxa]
MWVEITLPCRLKVGYIYRYIEIFSRTQLWNLRINFGEWIGGMEHTKTSPWRKSQMLKDAIYNLCCRYRLSSALFHSTIFYFCLHFAEIFLHLNLALVSV